MERNPSKPSGFPLEWVPPGSEKESVEQLLRNSTQALTLVSKLLRKKLEAVEASEGSSDDYDAPSWAFKAADRSGRKRTLRELLKLLEPFTTQR